MKLRVFIFAVVGLCAGCAQLDNYCDQPDDVRQAVRDAANASQNTVVFKDVCNGGHS